MLFIFKPKMKVLLYKKWFCKSRTQKVAKSTMNFYIVKSIQPHRPCLLLAHEKHLDLQW